MTLHVSTLPFATDRGLGTRARLGLVAAASDAVIEHDFREIIGGMTDVELYTARYDGRNLAPHHDARDALAALIPTTNLLLPGERLDAVALACGTSALTTGEDAIEGMFRQSRPGLHVVTPAGAIRAALSTFGIRHLGVLTPYRGAFNTQIDRALTKGGVTVAILGSFDEERDAIIGTITPSSIRETVLTLAEIAPIDGFLIVGSQLRSIRIVGELDLNLHTYHSLTPHHI